MPLPHTKVPTTTQKVLRKHPVATSCKWPQTEEPDLIRHQMIHSSITRSWRCVLGVSQRNRLAFASTGRDFWGHVAPHTQPANMTTHHVCEFAFSATFLRAFLRALPQKYAIRAGHVDALDSHDFLHHGPATVNASSGSAALLHQPTRLLGGGRYQYLELAYYITHGRCPDPDNPGEHGFILNLYTYPSMDIYLRESPKAVSKDSGDVYAKEFAFASRVSLEHGYVKEDRAFMYRDNKVSSCCHTTPCPYSVSSGLETLPLCAPGAQSR
jgi:hypothetical protein